METRPFDAANYIQGADDVAAYLNVVLDEDDPDALVKALGTVARSEGMTKVAERAGVSRESLYRSLGGSGKPSFATVYRVLSACGLRLSVSQDDRELATA